MYIPHFRYPFLGGWPYSGFYFLDAVSNVAINMSLKASLWHVDLESLGCTPPNDIDESYRSSRVLGFGRTSILVFTVAV